MKTQEKIEEITMMEEWWIDMSEGVGEEQIYESPKHIEGMGQIQKN